MSGSDAKIRLVLNMARILALSDSCLFINRSGEGPDTARLCLVEPAPTCTERPLSQAVPAMPS